MRRSPGSTARCRHDRRDNPGDGFGVIDRFRAIGEDSGTVFNVVVLDGEFESAALGRGVRWERDDLPVYHLADGRLLSSRDDGCFELPKTGKVFRKL